MTTLVIAVTTSGGRPFRNAAREGVFMQRPRHGTAPQIVIDSTAGIREAARFNTGGDAEAYALQGGMGADAEGFPINHAILHVLPWAIAEAEAQARAEWEGRTS